MVRAHRRLQDFGRQGHVIGVDRPSEHDRKFGEARHLVEQPRIGFDGNLQLRRTASEIGADQLSALVMIDDDIRVLEFFEIFRGAVDAELAR